MPVAEPSAPLADLIGRCADGDDSAFAELHPQIEGRLYGLALRILRDPAVAEEVTQDALLMIWASSPSFDPSRGSALAWMFTIAHRRSVDRARSIAATRRRDDRHARRDGESPLDATGDLALSLVEGQVVRAALASLDAPLRRAVELAFLSGLSHAEVAVALQVPLGTAKTRIRTGLTRLRVILEDIGRQRASA